jgi:hypothetical protein
MADHTATSDQRTEEKERTLKPQDVGSDDLDVEPGDAAQVRGGFTPVPIPEPKEH